MIKKIIFTLIVILSLSCTQTEGKDNIYGNWYSNSSIILENGTIDYSEVFIKKDTVHICSEYILRMVPRKIILKNDSLFFFSKTDSNFIGNLLKYSENSFDLGIKKLNKRTYYKLENNTNLGNLISGKITEKEYYLEFTNRMNREYEKINGK